MIVAKTIRDGTLQYDFSREAEKIYLLASGMYVKVSTWQVKKYCLQNSIG